MILTEPQRKLLGELCHWRILALLDDPDYWCKHLRDGQGSGSVRRDSWPDGYYRQTYSWGIAVTARGDHMSDRKRTDPAHAAALTWAQITRWSDSLPDELRAEARRNWKADADVQAELAARIIAHGAVEELALW